MKTATIRADVSGSRVASLFAATALATSVAWPLGVAADPVPAAAAAAGYRVETVASNSFTPLSVDKGLTYRSGFKWYFNNFQGVTPNSSLATFNSDGSITLADATNGWAGYGTFLTSAASKYTGYQNFVGTAFGGGGYFEATLSFNPALVNPNNGAWPAWWSMSIEHMLGRAQWTGQRPGFEHYVEPDFMEYESTTSAANYGGNVHDWYGMNNSGNYFLPFGTVVRNVPVNTNFNQYHRYGFLWIPATAMTKGAMSYYFDGVQVGPTTYYSQYTNQPPPPGANTPWTFGIIDKQHLVLTVGTGPPVPMQVKSIQVWQRTAASNIHN